MIVGAGIGGLAAAHELEQLARRRRRPLELVVLDAAERAGGVVGTESYQGALLERGPDSLVTHKPAGVELCRRLGLGDRLEPLPSGRAEILHRGRLVPVPAGFALLAPTRRWPLIASPLLGWRGKLRALREPAIAPAAPASDQDESVASFVRRRFGAELLERIIEPIVGAITLADVERLSLAATFPRFLALEREWGSVARGLRAAESARVRATPATPAIPAIIALGGGLGQIVTALVAALPPGALRLGARVEGLVRAGDGFALRLADGGSLAAAAVLLALPAPAAGSLLGDLDSTLAGRLQEIAYATCVTVHLGWPTEAAARPPESLGFFVPRGAGLPLVAAGFVHVKFPRRVPEDQLVARLFFGDALQPEASDRTDEEIVAAGTRALAPLLGLCEPPTWSRIVRHPRALPERAVGHLARVAQLLARSAEHPGLELAGGPLGAYGVPDSIAAAQAAAARLFDGLVSGRSG